MSGRITLVIILLFCVVIVLAQEAEAVPELQSSVPLSEIIIDDFSNFSDRFLPYSKAQRADILEARNRQRPFCHGALAVCLPPRYEDRITSNQFLSPHSMILGYVSKSGNAYAYPFEVLGFHGVVNDVIDGEEILVTFCLQCNGAAIFSRRTDDSTLEFGTISAYYQNVSLIYDLQSESLWLSISGQGIVGDHTNLQLQQLPHRISTWQDWQTDYPDTSVLARYPHYANYNSTFVDENRTRFNLGRFTYPMSREILADNRLGFGESVLVVQQEDTVVAYPLERFDTNIIQDEIDNKSITILMQLLNNQMMIGAAYLPQTDDLDLELEMDSMTGNWHDSRNNVTVDYLGFIIDGSHKGEQLPLVSSQYMYWFAARAAYPKLKLYKVPN